MKISELINKVQEEKPNTFSDAKIISFITEIEAEVAEQLQEELPEYTEADVNKILLAPTPYDRLYVSYVKAMVDYANEEYASYQLNAEQHTQDFRDFVDWVVRTKQVQENRLMPSRFRHVW